MDPPTRHLRADGGALIDCPVPIIGAVNGAAYGGGCEIAGACDFLYAADSARFALTEVTLGIMPGGGGTQTLPRAVGERRAKELILTGKPFTAACNCRCGTASHWKSRPITAWSRPRTAARVYWPSTRSERPISRGGEIAFSSEVDTGSREENASNKNPGSVLIESEPKPLNRTGSACGSRLRLRSSASSISSPHRHWRRSRRACCPPPARGGRAPRSDRGCGPAPGRRRATARRHRVFWRYRHRSWSCPAEFCARCRRRRG